MTDRRKAYPFDRLEPKWQARWDEEQTFHAPNPGEPGFDATRPKYYVLDMFPYPSGAGLHVGHPEGYTATDIIARYKRMCGCNVLHPMGWDAFGLPAEQYAIKTGQHPAVTTARNVAHFKTQLKRIGFAYDWQREVNTTDPGYFKWTQWIFLQLYQSWFNPQTQRAEPIDTFSGRDPDSVRLAYVSEAPVNWCPALGTVLANEEVIDGKSEVGGHPVERRPMRQWMLRITAYAQRLIEELAGLDWPEGIKLLQKNWIGRSEGAEVNFAVADAEATIPVFTTRPDTLFGATYMVLAPEHSLVDLLTAEEQWPEVRAYRERTARKSDLERTELAKEKTGVFTGAFAINPVNQEHIPIWIADYVLLGYGTGAIMAVPAHDERDWEFAQKYALPIRQVVRSIGFQPMKGTHRPEADAPCFKTLDPFAPVQKRQGAHLPHWRQEGVTYAVCFRLADSLPQSVLDQWRFEREDIARTARQMERESSEHEERRLVELFSQKIDAHLDAGEGECWMNDSRIAEIVAMALRHFDGTRYRLAAWCVMPNHVHVVLQPLPGHELSEILHSWKSFTANEANKLLRRQGNFWQPESFDHIIRDEEELGRQIDYVERNPEKAGLRDWKYRSFGFQPGRSGHRLEADATERCDAAECFTGDGIAINSPLIDALPTTEAKTKITAWLEERGVGKKTINYKLRDWLFSRQRYWGEPFPIVWESGPDGHRNRALDAAELPLVPPELDDFKPTGTGEPPLAKAREWLRYSDTATRETNTMPQWAGSCWYYLRYCDPRNSDRFVSEAAQNYWLGGEKPGGVDLYVGGTEHAVLHLLYARFWHKVLFDLGHVTTPEPFQRLVNQGIILGEDGQKMSKSRGNVVNPDDVIAEYGADAFRCYEMFMGPLEQMKPWSMTGVEGVSRFLARVWRLIMEENQAGDWAPSPAVQDVEPDRGQFKVIHSTIKKVTADIETLSFNTAISQMMVFVNAFTNAPVKPLTAMRTLLVLLNPFAPHVTEELWEQLGGAGLVAHQTWPAWEESYLIEDEIEIVVQVNGKLRDKVVVQKDAPAADVEKAALAAPKVTEHLAGKTVRKVVVVPGKLVNVVAT